MELTLQLQANMFFDMNHPCLLPPFLLLCAWPEASLSIILLLGPKPWLLLQRTLAASLQEPQRLVYSTGLG